MRIRNISVKNYRLLQDVSVNLENDITLIIGKNNSGKTSFFEAVKMFLTNEEKVSFEDLSLGCYPYFEAANEYYLDSIKSDISEEEKKRAELRTQQFTPKIEVKIEIEYDVVDDSLIELSEFITDLDINRNDATILVTYEPKNSLGLYNSFNSRDDISMSFINFLKINIDKFYSLNCYAYDKYSNFKREIDGSYRDKIKKVVSFEDIKALRILDDKKGDRHNTLSLGFSKYYHERDKTNDNIIELELALQDVGVVLKDKYEVILDKIIDDLKNFGAKTPIVMPEIVIDSVFDSEAVIKNNIKYLYKQGEVNLPESYNGLGYSNLIYMVLEFASFIEKFKNSKEEKLSEFLTVLIEEPEAHMHPQMQQVFISQIKGLLRKAKIEGVDIQLIITSHSSHIISEAGIDVDRGFNKLRYFNKGLNNIIIQDFNNLIINDEKRTFRFLKQYLNIHKSDLFFADKVILVEGITEKMLLPQMIDKVSPELKNEYITVLEVGGAYTHKFKEILEFIGVKTLIITDLDSVVKDVKDGKKVYKKCSVELGEFTSNATLKNWLPGKNKIEELNVCVEDDKIDNDIIRVAYQIPENLDSYVSRSFEEAFINKNRNFILSEKSIDIKGVVHVKKVKNLFSLFKNKLEEDLMKKSAYELAPNDKNKTNFAFDIMSLEEEIYGTWEVPLYIMEGLLWLAKN